MRHLKFLSLLSLLGLLGLITDNTGFYGFFGFLGFAGMARIKDDELYVKNLRKAGLSAFVVSSIGLALGVAIAAFTDNLRIFAILVAGVFALQILTFVISFHIYESRGE